jgi:hypothetical protein
MHLALGQHFLSAPVFGRPEAATAAKALHRGGGQPCRFSAGRDFVRVQSVSEVSMSVKRPLSANLVKLCGNFMILSAIEAMGEAMTLAQKGGIAKQQLLEVLTGTLFDSPVYRNYGVALVEDRYQASRFRGAARPEGHASGRAIGGSAARADAITECAARSPAANHQHRGRRLSIGQASGAPSRKMLGSEHNRTGGRGARFRRWGYCAVPPPWTAVACWIRALICSKSATKLGRTVPQIQSQIVV